jgi:hypothetical protein
LGSQQEAPPPSIEKHHLPNFERQIRSSRKKVQLSGNNQSRQNTLQPVSHCLAIVAQDVFMQSKYMLKSCMFSPSAFAYSDHQLALHFWHTLRARTVSENNV